MLILFFLLISIYVSQCNITIKDAGVAALTRGDIGMIFYVTLHNIGNCKYHVNVKTIKCCEMFAENDMDCQLMNLIGSDMGLLYPNITKNISLLYPNMYLHNRKGQCLVKITYTTGKNSAYEIMEKISFNTFINTTCTNPVLRGYYSACEHTKCETVDQDSLSTCEPVNCQMKYLGSRNYFNRKWKRCQKVPVCIADPEKDLPDVSYLPISNMCRDLEDLISVDDLKYLEKGIVEGYWKHQPAPALSANLRCHHGTLSNETGFCVCDEGWMSVPLDKDQYEPSLSIYHMCNIEIGTWKDLNNAKIKMTALVLLIFGSLTTTCIVMLSFLCHFCHKCIMKRSSYLPPESKTATHYSSETEGSETHNYDDSSPKSLSTESLTALPSSGSLRTAAKRDSVTFHRKSVVARRSSSDTALRIVRKASRQNSKETNESEAIGESIDDASLEQTEPFYPDRSHKNNINNDE